MTAQLERLAVAEIQLLPITALPNHFVFERDGFAALVERTPQGGFGRVGSSGLLTEKGFAALLWRGPEAFFVAKGFERAATQDEIARLRAFSRDLQNALE